MKINEKRVARPSKAAKLEIHFEGNLICCKRAKKNILKSAEEPHGVSVCFVCVWACVCGRWGRHALNSSAERRETLESVNNSGNSALFLHDCSPALRFWMQLQDGRTTCQKLLGTKKFGLLTLGVSLFVFVVRGCARGWMGGATRACTENRSHEIRYLCLKQYTAQFGL